MYRHEVFHVFMHISSWLFLMLAIFFYPYQLIYSFITYFGLIKVLSFFDIFYFCPFHNFFAVIFVISFVLLSFGLIFSCLFFIALKIFQNTEHQISPVNRTFSVQYACLLSAHFVEQVSRTCFSRVAEMLSPSKVAHFSRSCLWQAELWLLLTVSCALHIYCLSFCNRLISLSIIFPRIIQVFTTRKISFSAVCLHHIFCIY